MPLNVIKSDGNKVAIHSPQDFERSLSIRYLPKLEFADSKARKKIEKRCQKALEKEWITPKQKWLGHYYSEGIRGTPHLDLTIAWISNEIGYGVWTNQDIPANSFVGEYTGILRKRRFWGRWKNLYCFDYTTGPKRSTSFVIDCQDGGNHTRFINHASTPNLQLVSVFYEGIMHVILYAKEDIPAGTQLCYDYGEDYWEKRGKPIDLPR